jgi:hypothetical protein
VRDILEPRSERDLASGGFLEADAERLRATPAGLQRLDAVIAALVKS